MGATSPASSSPDPVEELGAGRPPLAERAVFASLVLRVADRDGAADWYAEHLGVEVDRGSDGSHRIASFRLANLVVSLWELQPDEQPPRGTMSDPYPVVVIEAGAAELQSQLLEAGVDVDAPLRSSRMDFFRFRDLDGNVWEVAQPRS